MDKEIIDIGKKRLENLITSASADIADAAQLSEQLMAMTLISNELIISAQRKMEEVYILATESR